MATKPVGQLELQVADVQAEARDVILLELRDARGAALPPFEPGAHLEIRLPNGLIRHYSLLNDSRETDRYLVAVGRAPGGGRGGSAHVHGSVRCGVPLVASAPRNNFRLDPGARAYRFVAGGIGITPILSMIRWCEANGRPWHLFYAARSRQRAAFYEDLRPFAPERVHFHFDDEQGGVLDVTDALAGLADAEQVYCCGPQPLMRAVEAATASLPAGTARFEWFAAPQEAPAQAPAAGAASTEGAAADAEFRVELARSGATLVVPPGLSILDVLEQNGFEVPFSCREGLCRTCETGVRGGEPEHRDYVLSSEERLENRSIMVCVSRSRSPVLVLDL